MNSYEKPDALSLELKVVFDPEFIKEVLDKKIADESVPRAQLLRSSTSRTLVCKGVLQTFIERTGTNARLAELAFYTPTELRRMVRLGDKTLRWLEEYLHLLGVVLPKTRSVHGMSDETRKFLSSL